jgi:tripartite-type tricarboxylate transporter receptor subunit TctC
MSCRRLLRRGAAIIAATIGFSIPGHAQTGESFEGKTVTIYVGNPVGGGYDIYGRLLARHLGRHLPGHPSVIVSNLVGGQSITCANFIYNVAPRDGTAIGILNQNIAEEQVFGTEGARFDVTRFGWVGRMASNVEVTYVRHDVPVNSIEDLKTRETIFAADGPGSIVYALLLNGMIGTHFKLVRGFPGTQAANLAMERGEVDGATGSLHTFRTIARDLWENHKVKIIMQNTMERSPEIPDVPAVVELGNSPQDKAVLGFFAGAGLVGRSFVAPPGLTKDRLGVLRRAFDATMADEQLLADARQMSLEVDPLSGGAVETIIGQSIALHAAERERAREVRWR